MSALREEMCTRDGIQYAPATPVKTEFRLQTCHSRTCRDTEMPRSINHPSGEGST
jgi:hypothetical protein